jgi:hypothetical protein
VTREPKTPATPDEQLEKLRKKQKADRKRIREIEKRMEERGKDIDRWKREDKRLEALADHGVQEPWLVITEADRAEASVGGLDENFLVVSLAVLRHETGIPQRAVFGHDHPDPGDRPPYYGHAVTHDRGRAFLRALHSDAWTYMNGVHWTQTTWYEKVFRVESVSADLTDAQAHLRVCLGDLAVLIKDRGLHDGVMGYNGSGPAAEAYANAILNTEMPTARSWLSDR